MTVTVTTIEEAARLYRRVEASLEAKSKTYEESIKKEKDALKQLETIMRAMLNQAGATSVDIAGVAEVVIVPKRTFGNSDWDLFYDWVVQNNCPELFQKRLHEGNMQHWIDTHPGADLPPGVNVFTEHTLKLLKSKKG